MFLSTFNFNKQFLEIFDEDGNGEVDFKEFIQGVSQFSVKGDKDTKLRYRVVVNIYFRGWSPISVYWEYKA